MSIKNFKELAVTSARKQALIIAEAGYEAINTRGVMERSVSYNAGSQLLEINGRKFDLTKYERVICVGFGKAALDAVTVINEKLGDRIGCGLVLDLREGVLENIVCRIGTHPYPTMVNVRATGELVQMLEEAGEKDFILCVVSGGGSSLLCSPYDMSCETESSIESALTGKGASISEMNTVRKHISKVRGGNLAKICYPATVVSLIFSDIPGDDISMVASGPTVKDETTTDDAAEVLKRYNVLDMCNLPSCSLAETPKEPHYFEKVSNILLVSASQAVGAMQRKAEDLGFTTSVHSIAMQGDATEVALDFVVAAKSKHMQCLIGAGETTVRVSAPGKGGRCTHMALAALSAVGEDQVFLPFASDGHDNTDAAGAIADSHTLKIAGRLGLDPTSQLEANQSYDFFKQTESLLMTGPTGSNVSDLFICLKI